MNVIGSNKRVRSAFYLLGSALMFCSYASAEESGPVLNQPVDISPDFHDFTNQYYIADALADFNPESGEGNVTWARHAYATDLAFDDMFSQMKKVGGNEFPSGEYAANPKYPFSLQFVSPRTIRIRMKTGLPSKSQAASLMLVGVPPVDHSWKMTSTDKEIRYESAYGSVTIVKKPWHLEFRDAQGKLLTRTDHPADNGVSYTSVVPFSFVRRAKDYSRSIAATFSLSVGEKIFGCGESFTKLDKRGQKVVLCTQDARGGQNDQMYKPVPFFMSSRGYGMFMHTSTPITCDIGASFDALNTLMLGDDELDLFVFLGEPKDILNEYTNLTGKAAMPPLWSFGLWMSRITYSSEEGVRDVAAKLRQNRIPTDVIHIDTGWFETDWRCDYEFSKNRFKDPAKMIADLKKDGFHTSLWQLPYFVPKNRYFSELVEKDLVVKDPKGNLPAEDAILDFSNPAAVRWYQEKIGSLLKMGVGAIKADFGEAAPYNGIYASGKTGFYEHNLYPLRYQQAVAQITKQTTGDSIIWARSAWAGSQRYPTHWGGDVEITDSGMAATLRAGMSLGLCGFSFWSHDIGGFTQRTPAELYSRWLPFGMMTSHSRCHGQPPKEPWEYGDQFMDGFRAGVELKYRLMPYVYAQAKHCTERGLPMVRALFVEYPGDPGSWLIDDEYLFGSDILVAPLFAAKTTGRNVYLPPGKWIDYQTGKVYEGGWHVMETQKLPILLLVRDGAVLPHAQLAQSTMQMDWSKLDLVIYAAGAEKATGVICLPSDNALHPISLTKKDGKFVLDANPVAKQTTLKAVLYSE